MLRTFIVEYDNGRKLRIKAARVKQFENNYNFYTSQEGEMYWNNGEATVPKDGVVYVIPQDMLISSFEDTSLLPDIAASNDDSTDYARDTFFSEADKSPFTYEERKAVIHALKGASKKIHEKFSTTPQQKTDIEAKLGYLERKVKDLDKFNWKRLLITSLVGISVDLGFGTLIPSALLNIFKDVLSRFIERLTKGRNQIEANK
jgi:hypothetical protein